MTENVDKLNAQEETDEEPIVYTVQKDLKGWEFSRRDFLKGAVTTGTVTTAAATGAVMTVKDKSGEETLEAGKVLSGSIMLAMTMPAVAAVKPGDSFVQTWQFTNNSATNWCRGARLCLADADKMQIPPSVPVPDIGPGETTSVQLVMTAPAELSSYQGSWQLQAADNTNLMASGSFMLQTGCIVESPHPYENNMDETWIVTNPDTNAQSTRVHFSQVEIETGFDYISLKDAGGQEVQRITDSYPSGLWSDPVPGRTVQVQLVTDSSVTRWGFCLDQVTSQLYFTFLPMVLRKFAPPTPCTCDSVCGCDGYCSCDTVCTCDSVCTCQGHGHYWFPN